MKIKYFFLMLFLAALAIQFKASAQVEPTRIIEMKLKDPATKIDHVYRLNSANYMISFPFSGYTEIQPSSEGSCSISLDIAQDMDSFFLKWVSGEMGDAVGVITLSSNEGLKKTRMLSFTGGKIVGTSESFFNTDYVTGRQVSLTVETFSIDETMVFNVAKSVK